MEPGYFYLYLGVNFLIRGKVIEDLEESNCAFVPDKGENRWFFHWFLNCQLSLVKFICKESVGLKCCRFIDWLFVNVCFVVKAGVYYGWCLFSLTQNRNYFFRLLSLWRWARNYKLYIYIFLYKMIRILFWFSVVHSFAKFHNSIHILRFSKNRIRKKQSKCNVHRFHKRINGPRHCWNHIYNNNIYFISNELILSLSISFIWSMFSDFLKLMLLGLILVIGFFYVF